jgi:hypothetical protein
MRQTERRGEERRGERRGEERRGEERRGEERRGGRGGRRGRRGPDVLVGVLVEIVLHGLDVFPETRASDLSTDQPLQRSNSFEETAILLSAEPLLEEGLDGDSRVEPDLHPVLDGDLARLHDSYPSFQQRPYQEVDMQHRTVR